MSPLFGKVKTKLDLNGPTLSFSTDPVSVASTGVGVGQTGGPNITLTGIATAGFLNDVASPPPCIAVIDEDNSGNPVADWSNFYSAWPNRKFNLLDVAGGGAVGVPSTSQAGVIQNFRKFDVNRDNGVVANASDWFDIVGLSTFTGNSTVSLWVDVSGSMTPSNVQASLDLFLSKCESAGFTVEQSSNPAAYNESYIQPFITDLVGPPAPVNKGAIAYQWYENSLGKLTDGTKYSGTNTTTLTVSNIITPTDDGTEYYLEADYVPGQPGARTGNALNEPLNSGIATVTVNPILDIISQPSTTATIQNVNTTFTISAQLSNGSTGGISYQWQIDEQDITDGDISYNTSGSTTYNQQLVDGGSFVIPADATDVKLDLAAGPGGDGGIGSPPGDYGTGGEGGAGKTAWFSIPNAGGKSITLHKGYRGQDGVAGGSGAAGAAAGGDTGTNTNFGASEGNLGGGGGGATSIRISDNSVSNLLAIVLGGGGGGGASGRTFQNPNNGQNGVDATSAFVQNTNGNIPLSAGGTGEGSAGSGGGGGGSGVTGANGGDEGVTIGLGGQGGVNTFDPNYVSLIGSSRNPSFTNSDGWGEINYTSASATPPTSQNITVSGTQTPTLTIRSDSILTRRIRCVVSHTSEDISDLISNEVNFICQSTVDTSNINIETIGTTSTATLSSHDLGSGSYTFDMVPSSSTSTVLYFSLYSPDKDIAIEMDLFGGIGESRGANGGGQGGYSRIRFTLEQNTEYIISGLNEVINAPFVYRKAALIACVGEGGGAGSDGGGGNGGGVNVSGDAGGGSTAGQPGGSVVPAGTLSGDGIFGSAYQSPTVYPGDSQATAEAGVGGPGGRTISCPKGVYWAQQPLASLGPCADISGSTKFRLSDGTEVTNTADLTRGYKAGYDIIQTAGVKGESTAGEGGNGATGGHGGTHLGGAGGGSGYTDGSVTIVDTQLGGSNGNSKVVIRLAV